jgi:hypothetical protein
MSTSEKKGFRNPMEFVLAAESSPAASNEPVDANVAGEGREAGRSPGFPKFPRKPATRPVNLRMDEALFWEISDFSKLSGVPITEIVQAGARTELARLKKKHGHE